MGMDMRIRVTASLMDVLGRYEISRWLSGARTGVILPIGQAFEMVEQANDCDSESRLD
jgi:hypothetical protein